MATKTPLAARDEKITSLGANSKDAALDALGDNTNGDAAVVTSQTIVSNLNGKKRNQSYKVGFSVEASDDAPAAPASGGAPSKGPAPAGDASKAPAPAGDKGGNPPAKA